MDLVDLRMVEQSVGTGLLATVAHHMDTVETLLITAELAASRDLATQDLPLLMVPVVLLMATKYVAIGQQEAAVLHTVTAVMEQTIVELDANLEHAHLHQHQSQLMVHAVLPMAEQSAVTGHKVVVALSMDIVEATLHTVAMDVNQELVKAIQPL